MISEQVDMRVVAFKDGEMWIAQCLEHDIATQAPDMDTLISRLKVTLDEEIAISDAANGSPFHFIPPTPHKFCDMWDQARGVKSSIDFIRLAIAG